MDALREIVKAHIHSARRFQELCELEPLAGGSALTAKNRAELVTTCQFYEEVKAILEELECEQ